MKRTSLFSCLFFLLIITGLFLFSCNKKKVVVETPVSIAMVSGAVELIHGDNRMTVEPGMPVQTGDILQTSAGASCAIKIRADRVVYVHENTQVTVEYLQESIFNLSCTVTQGELFVDYTAEPGENQTCTITSPMMSVVGGIASFGMQYFADKKISVVFVMNDSVMVCPNSQESFVLRECNKVLVTVDGNVSRIVSLTEKDRDELIVWTDKERITSLIADAQCLAENEPTVDAAPVWETEPTTICRPQETYAQKLLAKDPEGKALRFVLIKGPNGMKIAERDATVSFTPKRPGTYEIQIKAEDPAGNSAMLEYYLTVVGDLNAVLKVPEEVKAGTEFSIDASGSVNGKGTKKGLLYRFDFNNDGTWDFPKSGEFGSSATASHTIQKAGGYTITVQVKEPEGATAVASREIDVTVPPTIELSYTPSVGTLGTEFTLSVRQVNPEGAGAQLKVRWDLNGDGKWDYPVSGEQYSGETSIRHMWDKAGTYKVTAEVEDAAKNIVSVSRDVIVSQGISIEALQGPDTVNINEKVTVTCVARDPEFPLVEYAWDYAAVGMSNKKTKEPKVTFSYKEAGVYTFVCSVTNKKGMSASASKTIIVLNFATTVDAGGPYTAHVNEPVAVSGFAKDKDNKIIGYFWDFNNDKQYEWTSDKVAKTEHTFSEQGKYVIRFAAKSDDGTMSEDTALVNVVNRAPVANAGDDIVSQKKKKVKLKGTAKDADNNIDKYEWDFTGDGTFDWSSADTGYTVYEFTEYASAVLKVSDKDGGVDYDTVNIVICPKGMETIEDSAYCIDRYEWPNKKGAQPVTNVTYDQALAHCKAVGKRLCSYQEMVTACQGGKDRYAYPYGRHYEPDNCNSYGNRHIKNKKAPAGEFPECVSKYGLYDMTGNVAEWVSTGDGKYKYAVGGWWQYGEKRAQCNAYIPLEKNKKYVYVGFRCCK